VGILPTFVLLLHLPLGNLSMFCAVAIKLGKYHWSKRPLGPNMWKRPLPKQLPGSNQKSGLSKPGEARHRGTFWDNVGQCGTFWDDQKKYMYYDNQQTVIFLPTIFLKK